MIRFIIFVFLDLAASGDDPGPGFDSFWPPPRTPSSGPPDTCSAAASSASPSRVAVTSRWQQELDCPRSQANFHSSRHILATANFFPVFVELAEIFVSWLHFELD